MNGSRLHHLDYHVLGRVQGVYFRKYTLQQAKHLGLVGYVMNLEDKSVKGVAQGPIDKILALYSNTHQAKTG